MAMKKNENKSNQNQNPNQNQKANKAEAKREVVVIAKGVVISCEGVDVKAEMALIKLTDPTKLRDKLPQKSKKKAAADDVKAEMALIKLPDPTKLRDKLPQKTKKKAAADDSKPKKKAEDKKAPVTTADLRLSLHCPRCIGKICKLVWGTKGVQEMTLNEKKELMIVKGTMDAKALAESLKEMLKRPVEVVPPKKKKEGGGDGDKKDKDGGGGGKKKGGA